MKSVLNEQGHKWCKHCLDFFDTTNLTHWKPHNLSKKTPSPVCREKHRSRSREVYQKSPEDVKRRIKQSQLNSKARDRGKYLEKENRWRKTPKGKAYHTSYEKQPQNRIARNIRTRTRKALLSQNAIKSQSTEQLLGCSIKECKTYLESLFQPGMSWENIGLWHVDHIRPCASFNLTDLDQQKECFHYMNLQPLWAKDNLSKGCKTDWVK